MSATKYQILYRATNFNTGITITNDSSVQVEQLSEIYHDKHKITIGGIKEKKDATNKKNNDIIEGNDSSNEKYAQLYQYSGTKRVSKWVWIPESTGYVIRDYNKIRDQITNTNFGNEHGDYSGDYLLFEGDTPENGVVVAKENPMLKEYKNVQGNVFEIKNNEMAANGRYYANPDEVRDILINSTIAQIDWENHPWLVSLNGLTKGGADGQSKYWVLSPQKNGRGDIVNYYNLTVYVGNTFNPSPYLNSPSMGPSEVYDYLPKATVEAGIRTGTFPCTKVVLDPDYIKTYTIPGHWEESYEHPYAVRDVYEKVQQEPWFPYATPNSLEDALIKARALVDKIGLENVKLVKVVPTDQFLKIK